MIPSIQIEKTYCVHADPFCFNISNDQREVTEAAIRRKVTYGNKLNGKIILETSDKSRAIQAYNNQKHFCKTYKQQGFLSAEVSGYCCYIEEKNQQGSPIASSNIIEFYAEPYEEDGKNEVCL